VSQRDGLVKAPLPSRYYSTAGALNFNAFADPIAVQRFAAPGAPIAGWVGAKVRF
jgi:hypothetical protein